MATAIYQKALPAGVGQRIIWDGTNIDAINTMISSISNTDIRLKDGQLYVFGEEINIGDAVQLTDDIPAVPHAKAARADLEADEWQISAVVYEGNIDEIKAFAPSGSLSITAGLVYVGRDLVVDSDAVAKVGVFSPRLVHVSESRLAAEYTLFE